MGRPPRACPRRRTAAAQCEGSEPERVKRPCRSLHSRLRPSCRLGTGCDVKVRCGVDRVTPDRGGCPDEANRRRCRAPASRCRAGRCAATRGRRRRRPRADHRHRDRLGHRLRQRRPRPGRGIGRCRDPRRNGAGGPRCQRRRDAEGDRRGPRCGRQGRDHADRLAVAGRRPGGSRGGRQRLRRDKRRLGQDRARRCRRSHRRRRRGGSQHGLGADPVPQQRAQALPRRARKGGRRCPRERCGACDSRGSPARRDHDDHRGRVGVHPAGREGRSRRWRRRPSSPARRTRPRR